MPDGGQRWSNALRVYKDSCSNSKEEVTIVFHTQRVFKIMINLIIF